MKNKQAYIIRCVPNKFNHIDERIDEKKFFIGWSETSDQLLDRNLSWKSFDKPTSLTILL